MQKFSLCMANTYAGWKGTKSTSAKETKLAVFGECKFNDCIHIDEPGCAIIAAAESGKIEAPRFAFYQALIEQQRELRLTHPQWKK